MVASGEDQVALEDEKVSKKENIGDIQKRVLLPPQIQTEGYHMQIELIKAEKLVKMDDFLGSIDSYVLIEFGSAKFKSAIIKDNRNPTWGKNCFVIFKKRFCLILIYYK